MLKSELPVPQNVAEFSDKTFKEATKLNEVTWGGPLSNVMGVPTRGHDTDTQSEDREKTQIEDSIPKPKKGASEETTSANTLILDF